MSRFWSAAFPWFYRLLRLIDPPLRAWTLRLGLGDTVVVTIRSRRTGRPRRVLLGLLRVRGDWYIGHPNGPCGWTRNLDASGVATLQAAHLGPVAVRGIPLPVGEERHDTIEATFRQHPFPGNVIYWLARRHVRAVGRFYRLEIISSGGGSAPAGR